MQIFNGGLLAHYTVHPGKFFVEIIGKQYPFAWAKTWHMQLAIFWIAVSWVGTACYLAPLVAGKEPRGQRLLVNILFAAVVLVAVGSLFGEVLGIKGYLGDLWFWLGHQGWEYLELGRLWQILLFGGLIYWLVIVYRAMAPVLKPGNTMIANPDAKALSAILVFISGIPGTAHHYFWYGGPSFWLAIGGIFSSLEPVPLILLVTRAWMEYKEIRAQGREFPYKWPLLFLTASSVWNFIGAGLFGFTINLPIINYYEHATYLTSNHGHTALFGVYGMLAIALILFSWRGLVDNKHWNDKILKISFWGLNGGLFLMFSTGLLPIGLAQVWQVYEKGFWYARSAAFYEQPIIQALGNWRVVPDIILIVVGALPLLWFLLSTFPRLRKTCNR